jgi:hypothetical protein
MVRIDSLHVHELLARAITYSSLASHQDERLCGVFRALEEKQPAHYKLPCNVKKAALTIDWPLVLDAARGEIEAERQPGFELVEGLAALMCDAEKCMDGTGIGLGSQ